jgi:hypothetical protein
MSLSLVTRSLLLRGCREVAPYMTTKLGCHGALHTKLPCVRPSPEVSKANFSVSSTVQGPSSLVVAEKVIKNGKRHFYYQAAALGGTLTLGALAYHYQEKQPAQLDVEVTKTGFNEDLKKKALTLVDHLKDPTSTKSSFWGLCKNADRQSLCCVLHDQVARKRLIEFALEDSSRPENYLENNLRNIIEISFSTPECHSELGIVVARDVVHALMPKLTNSAIAAAPDKNAPKNIAKVLEQWLYLMSQEKSRAFANELMKTNTLQDLCLNPTWTELKKLHSFVYADVMELLLNARQNKTIVDMFKGHVDGSTALPDQFFKTIADHIEQDKWKSLGQGIFNSFSSEAKLREYAEKEQDYHLAIILADIRGLPKFTEGSWEDAFCKIAKERDIFYKKLNMAAWCLELKIPLNEFYQKRLMWCESRCTAEMWLQFFLSLKDKQSCEEAFRTLYPLMTNHKYLESGKNVMASLEAIYCRFESSLVLDIVKKMSASPTPMEKTFKTLHSIEELLAYQDQEMEYPHMNVEVVANILYMCHSAKTPEMSYALFAKFCSFYGLPDKHYFYGTLNPLHRASMVNQILRCMSEAELRGLIEVLAKDKEAFARVIRAATYHKGPSEGFDALRTQINNHPNKDLLQKECSSVEV